MDLQRRLVGIAKSLFRKAGLEKLNEALLEYRNTPISGINLSPSQMLLSRNLRTRLPITQTELKPTVKDQYREKVRNTTDFRQMEQGLLQLLEDFHSGKLEAFGQNCTFEKMENVREQQERLARLHFDLNAQQEIYGQHTDEGLKMAKGNLSKLMENLQKLSLSIEQLQSGSLGTDDEKS
ncbi:coiled-coil domain-containing protein 28B-like [Stegodyphus dumicola]|uniref:coiled-coil domain-containing protein 28B-like n=1 Tax=Stegodyphus dumicola TaxID=202533 RepID=UPI0015AD1AA0|nr:coiled-coil domain-containing protein 28B-like [Stegodyphus dumicola]